MEMTNIPNFNPGGEDAEIQPQNIDAEYNISNTGDNPITGHGDPDVERDPLQSG